MNLKTQKGIYLLRGDLKHKEEHRLTEDVTIYIAKEFENNLRERNPQIAYVEGIPEDNPFNLNYGDKIIVHHMVFFGEIAKDSPDYVLQPHVVHQYEKLFPCRLNDIYFRVLDNLEGSDQLVPLEGILLMEPVVDEEETASGIYIGSKERKDVASVVSGDSYHKGDQLLVETNALYPFVHNKVKYFRLRDSEVMGLINEDNVLIPANDRIVLKDGDLVKDSFLDLSLVKGVEDIQSEVISIGENVRDFEVGTTVLRRRSRGVRHNGLIVVTVQGKLDDESVWGTIIPK